MQAPPVDEYLASQTMPPNDLTVDPKYFNIRMVTPIGRFTNVDLEKPRGVKQPDGTTSDPRFAITLMMAAGTEQKPIVADLHRGIAAIANAKIPSINTPDPANPNQMITVTGEALLFRPKELGGLHYPLRRGNDLYIKDPVKNAIFKDMYFVNASMYPKTSKGDLQEPMTYDERNMRCPPTLFYRGCYGRAIMRCAWYDNPRGGKGVTFYLEGVQFARHGEKLSTFDLAGSVQNAFAAAGALPAAEPQPGAAGSNHGGGAPPGAGFAAPPAQTQPQAGFAQPPAGYIPPQQPQQPPQGGARPPGV